MWPRTAWATGSPCDEQALAGETGFAIYDDYGGGSGHNSLAGTGRTMSNSSATKVETVAFDEVVASLPAPIAFVKMDCEGGEYDLTFRSSPDSWASVQRLVLEYHDVEGQSWDGLRTWYEKRRAPGGQARAAHRHPRHRLAVPGSRLRPAASAS